MPTNISETITQLETEDAKRRIAKVYRISKKNIFLAIILTLIVPVVGYWYTGRWKAFALMLLTIIGISVAAIPNDVGFEAGVQLGLDLGMILGPIVGCIEQAVGLVRARRALKAAMPSQ